METATLSDGRTVKLGRIRPKARPITLHLTNYLDAAAAANLPGSVDYSEKAKASIAQMYLNDRYGDCVPPGTQMLMADGSVKSVEEVQEGDEVVTAEGNIGRVTATMQRWVDEDLIRVVAWGHSRLRLTKNHPVLTRNGYVDAGKLSDEDWIALPVRKTAGKISVNAASHVEETELYAVASTGGRCHAATLIAQRKNLTKSIDSLPENISLTPGFGRIIGLFMAEGSTNQNVVCWTFCHDEKDTLVAELVRLLKSELGLKSSLSVRKSVIHVRVCSKVWRMFFASMCGKGAHGKRLHPDLTDGPTDFLESVFNAWLDGDGCTHKSQRIGTTVSHSLALGMFNIAQTIGLTPTLNYRDQNKSKAPNGPDGELVEVNASPSWNVSVPSESAGRVWGSSGLRGVYWSNTEGNWVACVKNKGKSVRLGAFATEDAAGIAVNRYKKENRIYGDGRIEKCDSVVWRRVRRIEQKPYSGFVFNFEVDGDNSYVAEGIGAHNCVIAGKGHAVGVWSGNSNDGNPVLATDQEILSAYRTICGPSDQGCNITAVLDYMKSHGIVMGGKAQKIDAYVGIDWTSPDEVKAAIYLFGGLCLGINLPSAWEQSDDIWDVTNTRIIGGHDVEAVGFNAQGVIIATWGGLRTITWAAFTSHNWLDECYAMLAPQWYENNNLAPCGVNVIDLQADLDKLGNGNIPDINPTPGPTPGPNPTPGPGPKPFTLVEAIAAVQNGIDNGGPYGTTDDIVHLIKSAAVRSLVDAWLG